MHPFLTSILLTLLLAAPLWAEEEANPVDPTYSLKAVEAFQTGNEKWNAGDREGAVQAWREALVFDPSLKEARHNISVARSDRKILDSRESCLTSDDTLACLGSVNQLSATPATEIEQSIRYLDDAVHHNTDQHQVYMRDHVERPTEQYKKAEKWLAGELEKNPQNAESHHTLCATRRTLGRLEEAVEACRRAIELRPEHAESHHLLGSVYLELHRSWEAAAAFQKVTDLQPRSASAWFNLGLAHAADDQHQKAIDAYTRAVELDPENGAAHINLGAEYDALDQGSPALDHTRQAQQIFSDSSQWRQAARAEKNVNRFMKKYWGLAHKDRLF